jgi:hypothetical protein
LSQIVSQIAGAIILRSRRPGATKSSVTKPDVEDVAGQQAQRHAVEFADSATALNMQDNVIVHRFRFRTQIQSAAPAKRFAASAAD